MASRRITLVVDLDKGTVFESPESASIIDPGDDVTWEIKGPNPDIDVNVNHIQLEFREVANSGGRDLGPFEEIPGRELRSIRGNAVGGRQFKYFVLDVRDPDKAKELTWPPGQDGASIPRRGPPGGGGN